MQHWPHLSEMGPCLFRAFTIVPYSAFNEIWFYDSAISFEILKFYPRLFMDLK